MKMLISLLGLIMLTSIHAQISELRSAGTSVEEEQRQRLLEPAKAGGVTQNDLKNRVFSDRQGIYYLKTDPNNFSKLIRVKVD